MKMKARVEKLEALSMNNSEGDLEAEMAWWSHLICTPHAKPAHPEPKHRRLKLEDIVGMASMTEAEAKEYLLELSNKEGGAR